MTDMSGIISIAQRLTCYFLWESINTMLSVLFATEACYTIKENNNKEKLLYQPKLPFYWRKLIKAYFATAFFFAGANYHFSHANWEKLILRRHYLSAAKKSELQGLLQYSRIPWKKKFPCMFPKVLTESTCSWLVLYLIKYTDTITECCALKIGAPNFFTENSKRYKIF